MLAGGVAEPTQVTLDFDDFFQAEYRRLLALATALCGSRAIGEDVVQEAMFAASRQWGRSRRGISAQRRTRPNAS